LCRKTGFEEKSSQEYHGSSIGDLFIDAFDDPPQTPFVNKLISYLQPTHSREVGDIFG
jgi:hypothetical protein